MAKRNEISTLLLALLITSGLLGGLGWLGWRFLKSQGLVSPDLRGGTTAPNPSARGNSPANVVSRGEVALTPGSGSPEREQGIAAIAAGNFEQATTALASSLQAHRNDPEALIYLNNARIGTAAAHTIAVVVPVETAANPALEVLRGVAQAQTEINQAGGINGVPLRVLVAPDSPTPEGAAKVAQTLVDIPEVLAVVGHFSSDATLNSAPVYTAGTLPLISPTSTSVEISSVSDYVFRTVPSDRFAANALARYLLQTLNLQKAAVFFNAGSAYSRSLKDEFTTALFSEGGQVVAEFDLAAPGFKAASALSQLRSQGAEVIMLATNTATLDQALGVIAANNRQLPLLGGDSLYNPKILELGGSQAEGMVVAIPWHILAYPNAPFVTASRQQWGGDVNWRTAMTYDAVKAIAAAIATLPKVDRPSLQAALSAPSFQAQGATSPVKFLPSGDRNQAVQLVTIQPGTRSGFGFDFVPLPSKLRHTAPFP